MAFDLGGLINAAGKGAEGIAHAAGSAVGAAAPVVVKGIEAAGATAGAVGKGAVDTAAHLLDGAKDTIDKVSTAAQGCPQYVDGDPSDVEGADKNSVFIEVRKVIPNSGDVVVLQSTQQLRLSGKGVELFDIEKKSSFIGFRDFIFNEKISIRNCALLKKTWNTGDGLARGAYGAVLGAYVGGEGHSPFGPIGMAVMMATNAVEGASKTDWYLNIRTHSDEEMVFKLDCKSDGERVMQFLDRYMRA